ncbi:MAG: hypothetical protein ACK5Q5_24875, partial [Planctomycetaceae bacterium]
FNAVLRVLIHVDIPLYSDGEVLMCAVAGAFGAIEGLNEARKYIDEVRQAAKNAAEAAQDIQHTANQAQHTFNQLDHTAVVARAKVVAPTTTPHISPITGRPVNLNGRIRNLKPANGPTRFTPMRENGNSVSAGMEHVKSRHFGGSNTQSQFSITSDELKVVLQSDVVTHSPLRQIGTGRQAMWARDVQVGRTIGITRVADGGNPTSVIRVFVDEAGNLITTFPIPGT